VKNARVAPGAFLSEVGKRLESVLACEHDELVFLFTVFTFLSSTLLRSCRRQAQQRWIVLWRPPR